MIPVLIAHASRRLIPGMSVQPLHAAGGSSPAPAPGVRGPDPAPSSTGRAGRAKPPAAVAQVLPSPMPGAEQRQQTFLARPPQKAPSQDPPTAPSRGTPSLLPAPGFPARPKGQEEPALTPAGLLLRCALPMRPLSPSTTAGWRRPGRYMAEPSGLRRGPGGRGRLRLSAAGSHPSGSGGAQLSQAAVPEPMVQAERRGLPGSPVGSHGTLPAPSLWQGCVGAAARLSGQRETPSPQTSGQLGTVLTSSPAPTSPGVCHALLSPGRHHFCLSLSTAPTHKITTHPAMFWGSQPHGDTPGTARPRLERDF